MSQERRESRSKMRREDVMSDWEIVLDEIVCSRGAWIVAW